MIYLHIPFCHRKCTYCAFYSRVTGGGDSVTRYVSALCRELEQRSYAMKGSVKTIYFGGGTPSILSPDQLGRIVDILRINYDLSALEEVTIEANPEDLTPQYLDALRALELFDRLSIGVQSFHDHDLRTLNRRHTAQQAVEAVRSAQSAGFRNISVDLIYGLPGQSTEAWRDNLARVAELAVTHLSAYALTVEEGTILATQIGQGRVRLATDETMAEHYSALLDWTTTHGFEQYEISNFCQPGHHARHNSRYWNRTPYLGVGAAAHSFDGEYRRWNVADVAQYCSLLETSHVPHEEEQLTLRDAHNEYVMTALRTTEGIDKSLVPLPFAKSLAAKIQKYVSAGLVTDTGTHYRPTPDGLLHADGIASDLFE